jgi:hypothetical protein
MYATALLTCAFTVSYTRSRLATAFTWASRELPILLAAYARVESGERASISQLEEMRQELGMDVCEFERGLEALANAHPPYIELQLGGGWTDEKAGGGYVDGVSERTRRELGAWPTADTLVDQLADALRRAADDEPELERKGRLRQAADVVGGMARDVAVAVISARIGNA